jgi:hypothetical protein
MRERQVRTYIVALTACLAFALPALAKTVVGTNGRDVLRGTPQADRLDGRGGDDRLFGNGGADVLVGGAGNDVLVGGAGSDRLVARDGSPDVLQCGAGSDTAVVDPLDRVAADCETVRRPPTASYVIAGAGDIAGDGSGDEQTAALLARLDPDLVITTGDNAYPEGTLEEYQRYYAPTWGRYRSRTRPTPGNHDYMTSGATGYFEYFGDRVPGPYYSYDLGSWHLIALNSEIPYSTGSPQYEWLARDLMASNAMCTLAYWHKPRYSAGEYGDRPSISPLWRLLYAEGAELILNGHDHNYQRYGPLSPDGEADAARGIREIVVGTGGKSLYELRPDPRREAAYDQGYGVLEVTLRAAGFDWRFVPVAGSYSDKGSAPCR